MDNIYIKIRYKKIMALMISLFPIATLLQGMGPFGNINRVIMFVLILFLVVGLFSKSFEYREFVVLACGTALSVIAILLTGKPIVFNSLIYFPFWILFFVVMARDYKEFVEMLTEEEELLKRILFVWEAVVFISIFFNSSYTYDWGDKYFNSFAGSPHRFASSCLAMLAFIAVLYKKTKDKKYLIHFLVVNMGMFFCGARTYLIVGFVYMLAFYYVVLQNKKLFYMSLLPIVSIGIVLILLTPIGTKFITGFQGAGYYGYWATLTSGRSVIWADDLMAYWNLGFLKKLVGNGANFVYEINKAGISKRYIYAHNEYINLLCSNGILGVVLYFVAFYDFIKKAKDREKNEFVPFLGFYIIIYFNAFFNMLYTYPNAVVAVPFIYYSLSSVHNQE